jgi:Zn-dependent protease with chaperone function
VAQKLKPGLSAKHVMHPLDRAGLQAVMGKMGSLLGQGLFDRLMKEAEEDFYLLNLADNTKLGPTQGGSVYRLVAEVAETLGMSTPNVFLDTSPGLNPRTLGGAHASLVLPSALVDSMPEPALRAVIGHELGYILCGHSFYKLLAENFERLSQVAGMIPWLGPVLSAGFRLALLDWYRKAALSADRVSLLGTQDIRVVQQSLLWLAGSASRIGAELSVEGLSAQAEELKQETERKRAGGIVDRLGYFMSEVALQQAWCAHPWPATRLREITAWAASESYPALLAGNYDAPNEQAEKPPAPPPAAERTDPAGSATSLGKLSGRLGRLFGRSTPEQPAE